MRMSMKKQPAARMREATRVPGYILCWRMTGYICLLIIVHCSGFGQDTVRQELSTNKKRTRTAIIISATGYSISMAALYQLWYKESGKQSFRFFNDNAEWKQMDKIGHFGSAFYLSYGAHKTLQWCGTEKRKADWIASATGFLALLPIEIFDGYSDAYGASAGDLTANAAGSLLFYGQQAIWGEIRVYPKFSFHPTAFADQRPELLGIDVISQLFKDYNGQTHWLSFDLDKFASLPKWLNIAVGYGAEEMIYARDQQNIEANYRPYRQYYVSLDPDLTAIRTRSKVVKTLLSLANIIKIPSPTLDMSNRGVRFRPFYF
jgi:hypothetical protein